MSLENILIFDDFFNKEEQEYIETKLSNYEFPWYFEGKSLGTVNRQYHSEFSNENSFEYIQFFHWFVKDGKKVSDHIELINFIIDRIQIKTNKDFKFIRIKSNLQTKVTESRLHNTPHVDLPNMDHIVILYYVNDSDGKTFFYENQEKAKTITKIVESKRGRIAMFNGKHLHAGSHPKEGHRIVINFNGMEIKNETE